MRLAGFRMQRVVHERFSINAPHVVSTLDQRLRVRRIGAFVRLQSAAVLVDARPAHHRKRPMPVDPFGRPVARTMRWGERRQAFVGLDRPAILEEHLVRTPCGRIAYEHDDARGRTVQPMRGHDVRLAVPLTQADQRGFPIPHATWGRSQEMRLVDDEDALILIQDLIFEGNVRFLGHVPVPAPGIRPVVQPVTQR